MSNREVSVREISPIAVQRIKENKCPNCGKPKSEWKRRTDWRCCSIECTENYYREFDTSYSWQTFRVRIFRRDDSICKMCGKRFVKYSPVLEHDVPDESKLIGDHIIPIELGGAMWDMNNIQTLCIECNKIKTKEDIAHITVHRSRVKRWHEKTNVKEELINVSLLDKWF